MPGKPVASKYGLLQIIYGLLCGIVACFLGYLAFQVETCSQDMSALLPTLRMANDHQILAMKQGPG